MEAIKYALLCYAITAVFAMVIACVLHGVAIAVSKLGLKDDEEAPAASSPAASAASAVNEEALIAIAVAAANDKLNKKK